MNKEKQTITPEEAIEQGYTRFIEDGEDTCGFLKDYVTGNDKEELFLEINHEQSYWLIDKNPSFYTISPEDIAELLCDQVDNQDEFYDDDMYLNSSVTELLEEKPELFANLSDALNEKFKAMKFFRPMDTSVVFPKPQNDSV